MKVFFKKSVFVGINIVLPLVWGLGFYLVMREDSWITQTLTGGAGVPSLLKETAKILFPFEGHLADFLWAYSFTFVMGMLLEIRPAFIVAVVTETVLELIQLSPAIHMTFDVFDIVAELLATVLALLIVIRLRRRYSHEAIE